MIHFEFAREQHGLHRVRGGFGLVFEGLARSMIVAARSSNF